LRLIEATSSGKFAFTLRLRIRKLLRKEFPGKALPLSRPVSGRFSEFHS
jgi:hypothetical protein